MPNRPPGVKCFQSFETTRTKRGALGSSRRVKVRKTCTLPKGHNGKHGAY